MSYALSKERFPKKPDVAYVSEVCRKDFKKFKDNKGKVLIEHLSSLIKDLETKGIKPDLYTKQKDALESVSELIKMGAEEVAFTQFTKAFPYCLPHRSIF
ncbi:MAG TPA: hypothetical protein VMV43_06750 [Candidatus Nanopelagicaceae bacterium]|jgi:hypothetical protein|nr:hypothetical protein [Candidatus Nanopelagicaceae bacterium]